MVHIIMQYDRWAALIDRRALKKGDAFPHEMIALGATSEDQEPARIYDRKALLHFDPMGFVCGVYIERHPLTEEWYGDGWLKSLVGKISGEFMDKMLELVHGEGQKED